MKPIVPPRKFGKFLATDEIGEGGMGVVYLGSDPGIQRPVAIKVLKEGMPPEIKNRFKEEARAGFLNHQNLVTVFEIDEQDGVPYIVMEYLDGLPLDQLISSGMNLDLKDKLDIIVQVCNGLEYAHSRGVVHRDIKPPNVIRNKVDGRVKIVDFGIAKVKREMDTAGLTKTQGVIGTLGYMAPERLSGHSTEDGRIDIYSTGVMLYYLLTGKEPFAGAEIQSIMYKIVHESYPPLDLHLKGYPPALDAILARALAKNPNDRYAYAAEFADDLTGLLDDIKRAQVPNLLQEINRLFQERRWTQTLEKCREVLRIEPGNAEARALRDSVQKEQRKEDEEQQIARLWTDAEQAIIEKRWDQAINALSDLDRRRPGTAEYQAKLLEARDKKNTQDRVDALYHEAVGRKKAGDKTGAFALLKQAILLDQNNIPLLEEGNRLRKEIDAEALAEKAARHIASARQKIDARRFTEAIDDLEEVRRDKAFHPELDALEQKAIEGKKQQEYARIREQVEVQVNKLLFVDRYEEAIAEVENARPLLPPGDTALFPLMKKIREQAGISESNQKIADTLDQVRVLEANSIDEAIEFLRREMFSRPGVEQFEQLEYDLLKRKAAAEKDRKRLDCLRNTENALRTGDPALAVQTVDAYRQLQPGPDADLDALYKESLEAQGKERLRLRIVDCDTRSQSLMAEGRYDEAIQLLQPIVTETQNRSLSLRIKQAEEGKAELARRISVLGNQIAEFRRNNKLPEAIALAESHPELLRASSTLQEGLNLLRKELEVLRKDLEFKQRLSDALARSKQSLELGQWENASEPLNDFRRVYKDSEPLSRAVAEFEQLRTRTADQLVAKSIESAKAQTLTGDKDSARKTLQETATPRDFASPALTEEWDRLAEDLKVITETYRLPGPKPSKTPVWAIAAGVVVVALIGLVVWITRRPPPPPPAGSFIQITKAPAGASVKVDDETPVETDEQGEAKVPVKPGVPHRVEVTKKNFTPFSDESVVVEVGATVREPAKLTEITNAMGTVFFVSGNADEFKVFFGDDLKGSFNKSKPLILPAGQYNNVHFEAEGFDRSPDQQITVAQGETKNVMFNLVARTDSAAIGSFTASPNSVSKAGDQVTLSWRTSNATDLVLGPENEKVPANALKFGSKKVTVQADTTFTLTAMGTNGKPAMRSAIVKIVVGAPTATFTSDRTSAKPGEQINLRWETKNANTVSIEGPGLVGFSGKQPKGNVPVTIPTGLRDRAKYVLTANGPNASPQFTADVDITAPPAPPPTTSFSANRPSINAGESVNLTWTTQGATSVTIEPNIGISPGLSGTQAVKPAQSTTYTLIARNEDGKAVSANPVFIEVKTLVTAKSAEPTHQTADITPLLRSALDSFQKKIAGASSSKEKECKANLTSVLKAVGFPQGSLDGLVSSCAATFTPSASQCSAAQPINEKEATLSCDEAIAYITDDKSRRTTQYRHSLFTFAQNSDGSWKVAKWEYKPQ